MLQPTLTERRPPSTRPPASGLACGLAVLAGVGAALFRLIPFGYRPPNCTPVGALGLYGGGRLPWWLALPLPLLVMAGTDALLFAWYGETPYNRWVYASFVVYILLGRLLTGTNSPWRIGTVSALGSVQFFLLTNFGVWYGSLGLPGAMYPPTAAGLVQSYVMGLPFFGYTLLGDLGFAAVLFGAHTWLASLVAKPQADAEEVLG